MTILSSFNHLHIVPGNIKDDMLMNVEAALFHTMSEWRLSIYLPLNIMEKSGLGIRITFVFHLGKRFATT